MDKSFIRLGGRKNKKLALAAAYWVSGGVDDMAEAKKDIQVLGMSVAAADAYLEQVRTSQHDHDGFLVLGENWHTVSVFLHMSTQWRWAGGDAPRRMGLDYSAINIAIEIALPKKNERKKRRSEILSGLQIMEYAALNAMAKQQ